MKQIYELGTLSISLASQSMLWMSVECNCCYPQSHNLEQFRPVRADSFSKEWRGSKFEKWYYSGKKQRGHVQRDEMNEWNFLWPHISPYGFKNNGTQGLEWLGWNGETQKTKFMNSSGQCWSRPLTYVHIKNSTTSTGEMTHTVTRSKLI